MCVKLFICLLARNVSYGLFFFISPCKDCTRLLRALLDEGVGGEGDYL